MFPLKIRVTGILVRREQLSSASVSSSAGSPKHCPHTHSRARAQPGVRWGLTQAFLPTPQLPPSTPHSSHSPFSFSTLPYSAFFLSLNSTPRGRSQEEFGQSSPFPVLGPRLFPSQLWPLWGPGQPRTDMGSEHPSASPQLVCEVHLVGAELSREDPRSATDPFTRQSQ